MRGTMMNFPLTLPTILERSGKIFPRVEIVSRKPDGSIVRSCYGDFYRRARRLAAALKKLGLEPGDRVASMMWNHASHLEAFFGVPCAGGILHTLNLRLHPHEIAGIAKHAGDRFLLVDDVLYPIFEKFRDDVSFERVIVVPYGSSAVPEGFLNYEELLAASRDDFHYPAIEENDGAAMCFTSGTTGFSKGVIYSHRALVLHSFCCGLVEVLGLSEADTVLPVAPMFHANAWGIPFAATMLGARLVLPGPHVDPESVLGLMVGERVTIACGVPTVWIAVLDALEKNPVKWKFDSPVTVLCGGTAPPVELIRRLDRFGLHIKHLWGMTETAPIGTSGGLRAHMRGWPDEKKYDVRAKQGWPAPFVEIRLMRPEGEASWDGATSGEIEIRGPWVAASYFQSPDQAHRWTDDGWFRTGDVATIDPDGYMQIMDRRKDVIKSGGEWISSIDLENAAMGHPDVAEAAVIGLPHPKWDERPLLVVVAKPGCELAADAIIGFLEGKVAKWQLPDDVVFLLEMPHGATGKVLKTQLREMFKEHRLPTA
jgi:fatty-acyl-CoA synthase